ncbi:MAG: putative membrane protein YvbJ [Mariniblastus sp.]|jgi:uncharacterized membrane protein YvbJ
MNHCPFCGQKIPSDATTCKHCGKSVGSPPENESAKLVNLNTWEDKTVPTWVMVALIIGAVVVVAMVIKFGLENNGKPKEPVDPNSQAPTASLIEPPSPSVFPRV